MITNYAKQKVIPGVQDGCTNIITFSYMMLMMLQVLLMLIDYIKSYCILKHILYDIIEEMDAVWGRKDFW